MFHVEHSETSDSNRFANERDENGLTVLMSAVQFNPHIRVINALIKNGARVNGHDRHGADARGREQRISRALFNESENERR